MGVPDEGTPVAKGGRDEEVFGVCFGRSGNFDCL